MNGRKLIVAPLSTLPNWAHEFERWCPGMDVVLYLNSSRGCGRRAIGFPRDLPRRTVPTTTSTGKEYLKRCISDVKRMSYKELMDTYKKLSLPLPKNASKQKTRDELLKQFETTNDEIVLERMTPVVITSYGMI